MNILLSSNNSIIKTYLPHGAKVGFIPTASELDSDRWYMEKDREAITAMGFNRIDIDISNDDRADIIEKLKNIDAVFVAGGNTFYLLQQLKHKNLIDAIRAVARDKIYIGSSAGACIACPSIDYIQRLDDPAEAPLLKSYDALSLVDFYILPHYGSKEKYIQIANEIIEQYDGRKFIKLADNQAIIIRNDRTYSIVKTL